MKKKVNLINLEKFFLKIFGRINKRKRFVISAFLLAFLALISSFLNFNQAKYFIFFIGLVAYLLTFFSILEGIRRIEWLTLFILPVYFSIAFVFFYFLLPGRWLTRIPFIFIFTVSIYAILLSSNVFNVGVEKSLQLFRAAFSVNFLFLTITSFLVFNLILSFKLSFFLNFLLVFFLSLPLSFQFIWSIDPKDHFSFEVFKYSFLISLLLAELALFFSFIPLRSNIFALFLATCFYSFAGLFQAFLEGKLFKERIREYLIVLLVVLIVVGLSSSW